MEQPLVLRTIDRPQPRCASESPDARGDDAAEDTGDYALWLVQRLAMRDETAFARLYDRQHRLVYGIGLRILRDAGAAEDLTQGVFLELWERPAGFRGGNIGAWLARVARNGALDILRRQSSYERAMLAVDAPYASSLDDIVFKELNGEIVRRALLELPHAQREPIVMGFFGGITHEEIARRLETPLGTIKTRIRSGLLQLRASLGGSRGDSTSRARRGRRAGKGDG